MKSFDLYILSWSGVKGALTLCDWISRPTHIQQYNTTDLERMEECNLMFLILHCAGQKERH